MLVFAHLLPSLIHYLMKYWLLCVVQVLSHSIFISLLSFFNIWTSSSDRNRASLLLLMIIPLSSRGTVVYRPSKQNQIMMMGAR